MTLLVVEAAEENVVAEREEEGGEGASLFDSPCDVDVCFGVPPVGEEDLDIRHKALDDVDECGGEVDFVEHFDDEGVVDGVECFGCVEKEDVELLFFVES